MILRQIAWKLFGWPTVILIDFDDDETIAWAQRSPTGRWFAYRHRSIGVRVGLAENGEIAKKSRSDYVVRWVAASWCASWRPS